MGVYRGFVKSMGAVAPITVARSAAAELGGPTQSCGPSATQKLPEGGAEYNRHRPARPSPQRPCLSANTVALTRHPRYARRHVVCGVPTTSRPRIRRVSRPGMTTFDKREEAFEQQFAHDEELKFKATARRNKLLWLWAAEKLGLSDADTDSYELTVAKSDLEDAGAHCVPPKFRNIT